MIKTKRQASTKNLAKKAQAVFNKWIRQRDAGKGCISCGGGVHNAGHLYHAHIYSALRFNEVNVQGQCVPCNLAKGGNPEGFRQGLLKRYGEDKVNLLDSAARHKKTFSRTELELIIKAYATT
jgi:hypothetical protein